jgi:hypothetical protein
VKARAERLKAVRRGCDHRGMVERTVRRRRRPRRTPSEWVGPHPDRIASWAVVMGFALVLAALLSAHV